MDTYTVAGNTVIKTLIIDDHQMIRYGIKAMLHSFKKEMRLEVHEMDSGEKGLHYLSRNEIDLIIIDQHMEGLNGAQTIERILRFKPNMKILAISNYDEHEAITAMLDAGALGFVMKSVQPGELLAAIRSVLSGKKYLCSEAALVMIAAADAMAANKCSKYQITEREQEVLTLIVKGMTNMMIAEKLSVNHRTIDTYRQNLLKKLKVNNTAAMVRLALELKLVK